MLTCMADHQVHRRLRHALCVIADTLPSGYGASALVCVVVAMDGDVHLVSL
jgi:hypothetical protein